MSRGQLIKIYIADDELFGLEAAEAAVKPYPERFQVVGKSRSLQKAIEEICGITPRPDVVYMDIEFHLAPKMDGLTALEQVKKVCPEVRFIIFTAHKIPELPSLAFDRGAEGFLYRGDSSVEGLVNATQAVHAGLRAWSDEAFKMAQDWKAKYGRLFTQPVERTILVHLALNPGSNDEIGEELRIPGRRVAEYLQNIMDVLNIHRRDQLAKWAQDNLRLIP